ncbi:MAG: hypothetical protein NC410_10365, partial [Oscillibacter sp.]|nr:hypothetical protein [Oscillibacter sp.]
TVYFEYKVIIPEKYDALYQVTNAMRYGYYFLLAKEGNKWVVLNQQGKRAKRYPPQINKNLIKLPIKDDFERDVWGVIKKLSRIGKENAGIFAFKEIPGYQWNPYFE